MNFNVRFADKEQTQRAKSQTVGKISVRFDNIIPFIVSTIQRTDTAHIRGCVAWFSHAHILNALAKKESCQMVVTNDTFSKKTLTLYKKCKGFKTIGRKKGRRRPYMHHKFIIGLDSKKRPLWMLNGSFNYSYHATNCIENVFCTEEKKLIQMYLKEFTRVYKLARPIKK